MFHILQQRLSEPMPTHVSSCDHSKLRRLLAGQLSADQQLLVEAHLDECRSCCETLESLAADASWWEDASDLLQPEVRRDESSSSALIPSSPLSSVESTVGDIPLDFLEASDSPAMLGSLGGYDIIEPIGCGGVGVVLKGYDRELNRFVAVKVLAPHYATSAAARKRFAREAQAAAGVVHSHVLAIHSVDASGRLPYLVMPLVTGESLQERIAREGSLSLEEILRIGSQAARGLQAAHDQGLVHRDIKPGNILLERGVERVMLTDFGLARAVDDASMTRSGVIAGTPQFMSPEQARGDSIDHRSDLFSLGSVLYTMAAGRPPFRAETTMGLLNRIVETEPRSLQEINAAVPEWLCAIVARLHAKLPDARFESAGQLAELLEDCLAHVQQPTVSPLPGSLQKSRHRRSLRRLVVPGIVGALSVIAAVFFWPESNAKTDAVIADSTSEANGELAFPENSGAEVVDGSMSVASSAAEPAVSSDAFAGKSASTDSELFLPNPLHDESQVDSDLLSIENEIDALDELVEPPLFDGFPLSTILQPNAQSLPATTPQSTSED
jgi:serine/threonine protein kinase